jgi:hypothetical protein
VWRRVGEGLEEGCNYMRILSRAGILVEKMETIIKRYRYSDGQTRY